MSLRALALWLFVMNLGTVFGAGVYEHRIVVSRWTSDSSASGGRHWHGETARQDDVGRRFWAFVSTVPLTLLTVANLVLAWQASGALRAWWLAAALLALADRVLTFSYFIPAMVGLMAVPDSPEAAASASVWANLNHLRHAIVLAAWLASLNAFALFYQYANPDIIEQAIHKGRTLVQGGRT